MALSKFLVIGFRDLVRNKRRSILTALAIALGLVVVMAFSSILDGMVDTMLEDNIRLTTGHLQIRAESYEVGKSSLLARDLLRDGEGMAQRVEQLPEVESAAPVLWLGGLLSTPQESVGIQVVGMDLEDAFHDPIRNGVVDGEYLENDDRGRILVGKGLADQMGITTGQRVSLATSNANGVSQEGVFTVAGLIDTGYPSIDQHRVILPLTQAQSFSGVGDRYSSLILMLQEKDDASQVAANFASAETEVVTWEDLNSLILDSFQAGIVFYYVLYAIVFIAVAVLIANTLLMSVFARAREIGVLASLGMKGGQIMLLFLLEGLILAFFGILLGWVLGLSLVAYLTFEGITIPAETASLVEGFAFGTTMYGGFAFGQFIILSLLLLGIVGLVSLYPAWFAARMEPVEALHAL